MSWAASQGWRGWLVRSASGYHVLEHHPSWYSVPGFDGEFFYTNVLDLDMVRVVGFIERIVT